MGTDPRVGAGPGHYGTLTLCNSVIITFVLGAHYLNKTTVELTNKGQLGSERFVLYMKVVLSHKFSLKINSNNTLRYFMIS